MGENELLYYIYQDDEKALKYLFEMHEKNIYFCVKNTIEKCNFTCDFNDGFKEYIHIAEIELYHSIFNFRNDGKNTFQTFAMKCIEFRILQEIRHSRSKANNMVSTAVRLDDQIQEGESMYRVDTIKNPYPEFEGTYCMDIRNPKVIYEILLEKYNTDDLKIFILKIYGLSYKEIALKLGMDSKRVAYIFKNMRKFLFDTLTKKM